MRGIPGFCVIVGANGTGKSTLLSIFAFLQEAMRSDVQTALVKHGGSRAFAEVRSRESDGDIEIELKFRARKDDPKKGKNPLVTYSLIIGEKDNRAFVAREVLKYRRGNQGGPWEFLRFENGSGMAVTNEGLEQQFPQFQRPHRGHSAVNQTTRPNGGRIAADIPLPLSDARTCSIRPLSSELQASYSPCGNRQALFPAARFTLPSPTDKQKKPPGVTGVPACQARTYRRSDAA